ncbi:DsrE family protein [Cyanothece sp. BG0011]|uniref:DsrE family protein n=1 Tax=Cyanothece sp. BG0011 TaxID=2082950 RepID=UPI000D1E657A|nr:DsrE family protein [Cyanothece sp. BG0011]
MKVLQVIQSAYRCTIEEQDDPVVWFIQVLETIGGDVDIVLRANAVNYAVKGQVVEGLSFGEWKQSFPAKLDDDLQQCLDKGIKVYAISEDISKRGIPEGKLLAGIEKISFKELPKLFENYDQVWHW